ncbi:beta-1,3-galactosyltransferase 5-like [Discoglossus pictus]
MTVSQSEIKRTFRDFYNSIYSTKTNPSPDALRSYLDSCDLPKASEQNLEDLNAEVGVEEILETIKSLKSGKAPGPDGFTNSYYKVFGNILAPYLSSLFNVILRGGSMPPELSTANLGTMKCYYRTVIRVSVILAVMLFTAKQFWDLRSTSHLIYAKQNHLPLDTKNNLILPARGSITLSDAKYTYHLNFTTFQAELPYMQSYHCSVILSPKADPEGTTDPLLILAIKTHPSSKSKRNALRQTWARKGIVDGYRLRPIFLVGHSVVSGHMVKVENQEYNDILQFDFNEEHYNLSLKEYCFLEWLHYQLPKVDFIFKGDDDEYVNIGGIVKYITEHGNSQHTLHGAIQRNFRVFRHGKYSVSKTLYPFHKYPLFLSGGGFIFPGPTVKLLYEASQKIPVFPLNDVYFGFLVLASNLTFRHDNRFHVFGLEYHACEYKNALVVNGLEPDTLIMVWEDVKNTQC